jgi:NCAIR mutase (PurE)-related protein
MLRDVLNRYCKGEIPLDEAEKLIAGLRLETVSNLAHLDLGRSMRCGIPEVILAEGKDPAQLKRIAKMAVDTTGRCIISRIAPEHRRVIQELEGQKDVAITFHDMAHMAVISRVAAPERTGGVVAVIKIGRAHV